MLPHGFLGLWITLAPMIFGAGAHDGAQGVGAPGMHPVSASAQQPGGGEPAPSPVPEPATLALVGSGLLALSLAVRKRREQGDEAGKEG
ncbi:MAG: PEP-CTERM sorting domain-containing protein [Planctomycetota bacterium]